MYIVRPRLFMGNSVFFLYEFQVSENYSTKHFRYKVITLISVAFWNECLFHHCWNPFGRIAFIRRPVIYYFLSDNVYWYRYILISTVFIFSSMWCFQITFLSSHLKSFPSGKSVWFNNCYSQNGSSSPLQDRGMIALFIIQFIIDLESPFNKTIQYSKWTTWICSI